MKLSVYLSLLIVSAAILYSCSDMSTSTGIDPTKQQLSDYVNPFIGTGGHGHTFPGATLPFGMVQLSPDTRLEGWDGCGGYHYTDSIVYGFSHTHLSGTGVSDYGDILLKPCIGAVHLDNGYNSSPSEGYASYFKKTSEKASPGYYRMFLDEGIDVELTATTRAGMHSYTWEEGENPHVILDLLHRDQLIDASMVMKDAQTIYGHRSSNAWANDQRVYFWMTFSRPYTVIEKMETEVTPRPGEFSTVPTKAALSFDFSDLDPDEERIVTIAVGISAVGYEGAQKNLVEEMNKMSFEDIHDQAIAQWEKELHKIEVTDESEDNKEIFYTSLYHTMIAPNTYSDVDGQYRLPIPKAVANDGPSHRIGSLPEGDQQYTVFSLWDTYRATHPLYTITQQERTGQFIRTFLRQYKTGGQLPVWELASTYTGCMIGYHSVPVIADAYAKGITDFDTALALEAMTHSAEMEVLGLPTYMDKGFMATGDEPESVSKTLEYAYDDWCIADFASRLGNEKIATNYLKRAQNYKNLYNPANGFLQGRSNGGWYGPFRPEEVNFNYTEANGWQYSLAVPQDVNGLIDMMGGDEKFITHLDKMFSTSSETSGRHQVDITGLIGQYAHGNEPSHHMAYLYAYAGEASSTQRIVRQVMDSLYTTAPDGLSGNEDCGQMSAWYVMSAMGIYPVCPGSTTYVIGTPRFEQAKLNLENGKTFSFRTIGQNKGPYVVSATLNGMELTRGFIDHNDIMAGGELVYQMGSTASDWATTPLNRPQQRIIDSTFAITPAITAVARTFSESLEVSISAPQTDARIHYTVDGSTPSSMSTVYAAPIILDKTSTVKAISVVGDESKMVSAKFYKVEGERSITLDSEYANQYSAGGDRALIDMIQGGEEFTTGDWQGYREDIDVTIDLGEIRSFNTISAGFNQNIKSWIWFPTQVEIFIGDSPDKLKLVGTIENDFPDDTFGAHVKRFAKHFKNGSARYVRIRAKQYGECPEWHLGAGGKTWLFADEIVIE